MCISPVYVVEEKNLEKFWQGKKRHRIGKHWENCAYMFALVLHVPGSLVRLLQKLRLGLRLSAIVAPLG